MYCSNCGKDIGDSAYCYNCGAKADTDTYDDMEPEVSEEGYLPDEYEEDEEDSEENKYYPSSEKKSNNNSSKIITISAVSVILLIIVILIAYKPVMNSVENKKVYNKGIELYESGNYEAALEIFNSLGDYKDVSEKITLCNEAVYQNSLNSAIDAYNSGDYTTAITLLNGLNSSGNNAEVQEWIEKCREGVYQYAAEQYNNENFAEANKYFTMISGYRDADDMAAEAQKGSSYLSAIELYDAESYDEALEIFETMEGYKDADTYITNCRVMIMRAKWKPAFINYIKSDKDSSKHRYTFTYIDINSTPELYIESTNGGAPKLCVFNYYGEIDEYSLSVGSKAYIKASGLLYSELYSMDNVDIRIYSLSNLILTEIHSGGYVYTSSDNSKYTWDGKVVSRNECFEQAEAIFDSSKATTIKATYTASEMINYINSNF
ncbi:MAG: tetratricopeptide repeat protein [Clostridiales bacterium]|nr:tetratricopeptide repeat protein [Clostridiales bacterium]